MKKSEIGIRVLGGICAVFCWWGLLYPELTMTPDTYKVYWEETALAADREAQDFEKDIYRIFLETDREKIRFKSRLLEYLRR